MAKYNKEGCRVDWDDDDDDDEEESPIGGSADMNRMDKEVHSRMKQRMAKYKETGEFDESD